MSARHRNPEIYVKGYNSKRTTKEDLREWFKDYGRIVQVQFKGPYSFIVRPVITQEFEDYYDAEEAVEHMNDKKIEGRRLTVEPAGKKRYRDRSRDSYRRRKRYRRTTPRSRSSSSSRSRSDSSDDSRSRSRSSSPSEESRVQYTHSAEA